MYEDTYVKLNPYLSNSKNLIDYFIIIGFEEKILDQYDLSNINDNDDVKLSIISTITSNSYDDIFMPNNLIKQVYPDKPLIIANSQSMKLPEAINVVFSSCIDSIDGKKKIFFSYYALRYYEIYIDKNKIEYYVPKAFLIISQYPYFSTFHNLCIEIIYNSEEKNKLPIEIMIHCLLNYASSPINKNIILKDFEPNIKFSKISGYPYVDFNLCKIINIFSIKRLIRIYILIFLEIDLLIFSSDIQKLNLFMYSLYILNYPLTDSNYFWHIKTISKNDLDSDPGSIYSSFIGVNTQFNSDLNLSNYKGINYIVDLDAKKKFLNTINENKETEEISKLLNYIKRILQGYEVKSSFLSDILHSFQNKLISIKKEYDIIEKNI